MFPPPLTPPRQLSPGRVSLTASRSLPSQGGSASSFPDPWGNETTGAESRSRSTCSDSSTSTDPRRSTLAHDAPFVDPLPPNHRLPPRPSDLNEPAVSPQPNRETSPSRLSSVVFPLARMATAKHARSLSSPMGFKGDTSGGSPRPGAANLLATIFKTPESTPQSTPEKKKLFGFNLPSSPMIAPAWLSRAAPNSIDIIDEFAGIQFSAVLRSYLEEPIAAETSSTPADTLKRTPEGRLEEAVATGSDLLDRVYAAYRARTNSLSDAVGELDAQKEEIASCKMLNRNLKTQIDRLVTEEREARGVQSLHLDEQQRRIRELEAELLQERRRREVTEEELYLARRSRCKRTSTASDSGFESDVDSILSRGDPRGSAVVSPTEEVDEAASGGDHECESCHHPAAAAVGAETKFPTPLREAWRPDSSEGTTASKPGVWGFFKSRQQQIQQQQGWETRFGGDIESVRMENRWLRERVREQEKAIEGALDAIVGRI